jgi:hypothetical protein
VSEIVSALRVAGAFLGIWVAASIATCILLVPFFRMTRRAQILDEVRSRTRDWAVASTEPR